MGKLADRGRVFFVKVFRRGKDKKHNLLGIVLNVGILDLNASSGKPIDCDANTVIINTS
ncbi:unnamed protein product [Neisseria lactamica Y92-1009]|nr:unnamed protein product [Neisseria lactamica Y92-1009]